MSTAPTICADKPDVREERPLVELELRKENLQSVTMSTRPPSRVVFVGNIPYGLSEEQISDIFSQAGKVLNFRLVYDRETGRPKGFGFAEYPDSGTY